MKIAIDAGHGSDTPGKRTPPLKGDVDIDGDGQADIRAGEQYREHYASVGVCAMLDYALRRCGFEALRVSWDDDDGKDDVNMPLADRQAMIRAAGCEISVSVHFNAYGDGATFNSASGVCTYIHSNWTNVGDSRELAYIVQRNLAGGTAQKNRGVKEAGFAMCSCPATGTRAAILCELAFMTNEYEASLMTNPVFWSEAAEEICRGICEYTGAEYREEEEMSYEKFLEYMRRYEAEKAEEYTDPPEAPDVAQPMIYRRERDVHICEVDARNFVIDLCNKPKKSAAESDYCNAGFFAIYKEGGVSFTLPVGHLVSDFTASEPLVRKYCTERGKFLTPDKYQFDASKWTYDNPLSGNAVSTLLLSGGKARIEDVVSLPAGVDYAISGVPIMRSGSDVKFATYVQGQGWSASSLYATWHIFVGLKQNDPKIYVMAMKTATGNMILTAEAYKTFSLLDMWDVIKLDGGGSFFLNVAGKEIASTSENRLINTIIRFGPVKNSFVPPIYIVERGSIGHDVEVLQSLLNAKGFNCGDVDGVFGDQTEKAVVAFQGANNLTVDGRVGPQTWGALMI